MQPAAPVPRRQICNVAGCLRCDKCCSQVVLSVLYLHLLLSQTLLTQPFHVLVSTFAFFSNFAISDLEEARQGLLQSEGEAQSRQDEDQEHC